MILYDTCNEDGTDSEKKNNRQIVSTHLLGAWYAFQSHNKCETINNPIVIALRATYRKFISIRIGSEDGRTAFDPFANIVFKYAKSTN